jgi:predicted DNA-binding transcriptional regulator AlpA
MMAPRKLLGFAEVAELLQVSRQTAARYISRDDFPAPVERLSATPVWKTADVERWAKQVRSKLQPGRPKKPS